MENGTNGHGPDLDLSGFTQRLSVKVGDSSFTIPADMDLELLSRAATITKRAAATFKGEVDEGATDELYEVLALVMQRADPRPENVRDLLTPVAGVTFLGFLLKSAGEQTQEATSKLSAASPTTTAAE